jgi:2-amino-4-hydroxy-6-hydroxymethyldihydropteridine diphosphokinase
VTLAYVGLGANIGSPIATIHAAEDRLGDLPASVVRRRSSLYRTAPWGVVDQPDFINTVVEIETALQPLELLRALKSIEMELGREPATRWGPRVIDLDLLLYGDVSLATRELHVPHAEMWQRLFVLAPLAELRPDLHHSDGRSIVMVSDDLRSSQRVELIQPGNDS